MNVHVRDVVARMQVIDGDSLLTPQVLARIVAAVKQALEACDDDERSRKRDTRVADDDGCGCSKEDMR